MKPAPSSLRDFHAHFSTILLIMVLAVAFFTTIGCSSGSSSMPKLSGNTSVTVVLSSTANDQLSQFGIGLTGLSLTSQSGKTVQVMSAPQGTQQWAEFIHVNGSADPFVTVSIPQDIYTAATLTVGDSAFSCITLTPSGGLDTSTFAYGFNPNNAPPTTVAVNVSSPITITGDSIGLDLDLQVAQSATYSACYDPNGQYTYSIQPTFNLVPIAFSTQPTTRENGKVDQFEGEITALGAAGNTFTLTMPEGPRELAIKTDSNTAYQSISNLSALQVGTFVDMDGAIQPDGSLLATRIAALDLSAIDVQTGPAMIVGGDPRNPGTAGFFFSRRSQGTDRIPIFWPYNITNSVFQVSGQLTNPQTLPFVPSFNVSNIVPGQNVYISTNQFQVPTDPYSLATTVTLMPQTINGTVVASSAVGNFTDYTVSLASYNLFPQLAVQQGMISRLTNPSQVEVYVDSTTQRLNTQALASGATLRFYGLVFNDNGTLRMDCGEVNDGVALTPQTVSSAELKTGRVRTITRKDARGVEQIVTRVERSR